MSFRLLLQKNETRTVRWLLVNCSNRDVFDCCWGLFVVVVELLLLSCCYWCFILLYFVVLVRYYCSDEIYELLLYV